ncbi:hypothetical protein B9Z55_028066 [Caenorhabditis nigoni]|uniref:Uncharacterized protein n=1 Tax=Caenorhabditis nigoni TaxID=1611254 RepID=A0A2G5SDH8_9PELO|nr:hypothetical protein B9Z55_028066 [Caenorhabditis nigoni]
MNNIPLNLEAGNNPPIGDQVQMNNFLMQAAQNTLTGVYQLGIQNGVMAGIMPLNGNPNGGTLNAVVNANNNSLQDTVKLLLENQSQQHEKFRQEMMEHQTRMTNLAMEICTFLVHEQEENRAVIKEITESMISRFPGPCVPVLCDCDDESEDKEEPTTMNTLRRSPRHRNCSVSRQRDQATPYTTGRRSTRNVRPSTGNNGNKRDK